MTVIALTGATGDVGYEACRQLALVEEVTKIVITARSKEQAQAVIAQLKSDTGKDFFEYVVVNFRDLNSIMAAVSAFPKLDRLCLNAGGLGRCTMHAASGVTDAMVDNVLGHSILSDNLIKFGKISPGGRIVYVGSEVSRVIWSFRGLLPVYWRFGEKDIEWSMTSNYNGDCCFCVPIRRQLGDYKNSKIIGQTFYAAVAKELPAIHTMSVSPGGIGGSFAERGVFPLNLIMQHAPWMFSMINITHSLEEGAKRYVDVLTGDTPTWEPGSMAFSGPNCAGFECWTPWTGQLGPGCLWGALGPMVDNRAYEPYLRDEELNAKVAKAVRKYQDKWADNVLNEGMERDDMLPPSPVRTRYGKGSNWVSEREML